jgi:hypothetical protein
MEGRLIAIQPYPLDTRLVFDCMSQQSQTQKDTDATAQNEKAFTMGQKKPDMTAPRTSTTGQPTLTPNPMATKPDVAQTAEIDNPQANDPASDLEGTVDIPAAKNPDTVEADAKRDASPTQKPAPLNATQSPK